MGILELTGFFYILFTSLIGTAVVGLGAYRSVRLHLNMAKVGGELSRDLKLSNDEISKLVNR